MSGANRTVGEATESAPAGRKAGGETKLVRRLGAAAVRCADVLLAVAAGAVLLPFLLARGLRGRLRTGRWFEATRFVGRDGVPFDGLQFSGEFGGRLRRAAALWNVLRGDLSWVGPRPLTPAAAAPLLEVVPLRFSVRPGLVSRHRLRERTGVAYESETADDLDFVRGAGCVARAGILLRAAAVHLLFGRGAGARPAASFRLFGVPIANGSMDGALDWLVERASAPAGSAPPTQVAFVNPHCLNLADSHVDYRRVLQGCDRVFPDGSGIRLAARLCGVRLEANVNGTDLFPLLAERAVRAGLALYLLGARPGVAEETARRMQARVPGLRIAGVRDGYFDAEDEAAVIEEINCSGAAILLVARGVPDQEVWLARHRDALRVPLLAGVGGLFDFYSGRIPRAPRWLRELGLEWTWRLWQEPRRMWRRYLVGNARFLWRAWREARAGRVTPADRVERLFSGGRFALARRRLRVLALRGAWRAAVAGAHAGKRLLDFAVSAVALLLLSPLVALVALLVRLDSPGPVFFAQTRVGRWGREFKMYKFRSMYVDAEARKAALMARNEMAGGVLFKMRDDPRVTRVGRWLRKLSIDELPQLWHVATGEMSLVGPRPPVPAEVEQYSLADRRRLDTTPGITCIWQVSGRSQIPFPRQVELDVSYIDSQSLWLDVKLLLRTVPAVLLGRGAY